MSGSNVSVDSSNQPSKWFLTEEQIANLPSIRDGMTAEEEIRNRQKAASFITEMVERLNHNVRDRRSRITQLCVCTAMVFMHRFFSIHSMKKFDARDIAAACLFLAGKSEECPRKLEHIVQVWWYLKFSKQIPLDKNRYPDAAQLIVTLENCILQTLGFDLSVQVPHGHVLSAMNNLKISKKIVETAYWFATDILHITNWGVRLSASAIACVCVHLACAWADVDPQKNSPPDQQWHKSINTQLTEEDILKLADEFMLIYQNCSESLAIKKFALRNGVIFDRGLPSKSGASANNAESSSQQGGGNSESARQSSSGTSSSGQPRKSFMPDISAIKSVPELMSPFEKDGSKNYGKVPPPPLNPAPSDDRHRRKEGSSAHHGSSSSSRHSRHDERDRPSTTSSQQQPHHRKRAHDRTSTSEQHSNGSNERTENGNHKRSRPSNAADLFGAPVSANEATPPARDPQSNSILTSFDQNSSRVGECMPPLLTVALGVRQRLFDARATSSRV
ncbi:hypothetical protein L596_024347 [Steinernema carpocapsae]|uniref:Cyclin-like domain-containing protein n=1 Tax=Steinernema carpocapsae TaxID=34508 RepID=A0A4V5ZZP4_STECR|nr:hypothetical protein L596_024347 [Steinernema carpocapsae]